MKMTLTARNMIITPGITQRIQKKTARMERYLLPETEMQIKMRKDKNDLRVVEITVPMGNGVILRSEAAAESNLFLAIDDALAKIEKQIHRHRTKLGKRIREDAFTYEEPEYIEEDTTEEGGPAVVRTKNEDIPCPPHVGRRCSHPDGNAWTQLLRLREYRDGKDQRTVPEKGR